MTKKLIINHQSSIISFGFTLIELLITLTIIGILVTISYFGVSGARESARDSKRKTDLETIRSALEIYKSDCNQYPSPSGGRVPSPLRGSGASSSCPVSNIYAAAIPVDPQLQKNYSYVLVSPTTYILCTSLETPPNPPVDVSGCGSCGTGFSCNFKVGSP